MSNESIIKALGDNAKFYPRYLTNRIASDFKFHLNNGISKLLERNDQLAKENEELREALVMISLNSSFQTNMPHESDLIDKILNK